jgi:hypothetical protein
MPKVVGDDEQQTITDTSTKVSNAIGYSLHNTSDEDDYGQQLAKRQRVFLVSQLVSTTPTCPAWPETLPRMVLQLVISNYTRCDCHDVYRGQTRFSPFSK